MRHYIIVKFEDSVKVHDILDPIKQLFHQSIKIDGVDKVEVHISNSKLPNRHDLMIEMLVTPEGLTNFDHSEIHKEWKAEYGKYIVSKTIFDCD